MLRMFTADEIADLLSPALEFKGAVEDMGYQADKLMDYYPQIITLIGKMMTAETDDELNEMLEDIEYFLNDSKI